MKLKVHRAGCRGHANHGWLKTWHTFSFADYYNPDRMHFGALRVLNDDIIQAGMGFGTHPHDNMEIITIVLEGELAHRDSMGNGSVISAGEVQVMSAGTGIQHSEFNHSGENEVSLLQIWVFPDKKNVTPRYDQAKFQEDEMTGKWRTIVSPDGNDQTLWIHQQAWFSLGIFDENTTLAYQPKKADSGVYVFLISGEIQVGAETLNRRDGLCIEEIESEVTMKTVQKSKILVMEIPA
ncbi:MAG: pirin family protein [Prolixibacteraceae bacterium]|nr:pirin family protein [Prolixibacteraceae bacterium]